MQQEQDEIVDISPERERFFRVSGKMLKPCEATVADLVKQVPEKHLATTDLLRKVLAHQFQVQVTCPYTFKLALLAAANRPGHDLPYWRVLKQNGELNPRFPGGVEAQAEKLRQEGFMIDTSRAKYRVMHFYQHLVQFNLEG